MKSFNKMLNTLKSKLLANSNNVIIHNKFILYFLFFISLANLFYFSIEQDFISIITFILIGFITTYFSKNMLIILFIALTITNILKYGSAITNEGFEGDKEEPTEDETTDTEKKDKTDKKKDKNADKKDDTKEKKTNKEPLDNKEEKQETPEKKEVVISKKKLESGNLDEIHKEEEALKKKEENPEKSNDRTEETIKMFSKIVNALNS